MENQSQYVEAVEEALEEGCVDAADGGVPVQEIAHRVGSSYPSVRRHLDRLVAANRLRSVSGVDPETLRPRKSYIPTDKN